MASTEIDDKKGSVSERREAAGTGSRTQHLDGVLLSDEVDDLKRVLNDSDGHDLFAVIAAIHHESTRETFKHE